MLPADVRFLIYFCEKYNASMDDEEIPLTLKLRTRTIPRTQQEGNARRKKCKNLSKKVHKIIDDDDDDDDALVICSQSAFQTYCSQNENQSQSVFANYNLNQLPVQENDETVMRPETPPRPMQKTYILTKGHLTAIAQKLEIDCFVFWQKMAQLTNMEIHEFPRATPMASPSIRPYQLPPIESNNCQDILLHHPPYHEALLHTFGNNSCCEISMPEDERQFQEESKYTRYNITFESDSTVKSSPARECLSQVNQIQPVPDVEILNQIKSIFAMKISPKMEQKREEPMRNYCASPDMFSDISDC